MLSVYILWLASISTGTVYGLQGNLDSICFKIDRQYRDIMIAPNQIHKVVDWVSTEQCCTGYREINGSCEAECSTTCGHGKCTKPNVCVCDDNYTGSNCDILICPPGYTGVDCQDVCRENTFGRNCEGVSTCENGSCDPVSGRCDCYDGWSGLECSIPCPKGVSCLNGGICTTSNDSNSLCSCRAGYIGQRCENICEEGYWGDDCAEICECEDDHYFLCNHVNGTCTNKCENGEYFDETCWCDEGWNGEFCTEKLCPDGYYGENCDIPSFCQINTTKSCDRETGKCTCYPGWIGDNCQEACPYMTYGEGCKKSCICENDNVDGCNPITGDCKCRKGWTGTACNRLCSCVNGYCDNHGNCLCDPGWQGRTCNRECDAGYFGEGCAQFCGFLKEDENIICDRFYGPECAAGFTGEDCTEPCPEGRYGRDCKETCSCSSFKVCNRFTGHCECLPGKRGDRCEAACQNGTYGLSCSGHCQCPNCNVVNGDCCQQDRHGKCERYCPFEDFDQQNNECLIRKKCPGGSNTIRSCLIINFVLLFTLMFVLK